MLYHVISVAVSAVAIFSGFVWRLEKRCLFTSIILIFVTKRLLSRFFTMCRSPLLRDSRELSGPIVVVSHVFPENLLTDVFLTERSQAIEGFQDAKLAWCKVVRREMSMHSG